MRKGYIDTARGQVHYRASGNDGPFVFLLHMTPASSLQFETALPYLGEHCRAYALDTPGYGNSDPPPEQISAADYADRILDAIRRVTTGKVALCGSATGGLFALEIARRAPQSVSHIILHSLPFYTPDELAKQAGHLHEPRMNRDGSHVRRVWAETEEKFGQENDLRTVHQIALDRLAVYDRNLWGLKAVEESLRSGGMEGLLRAVTHPTLVLSSDNFILPYARRTADTIPGARLEVVAGSGSPLPMNAGQGYADHVLRFVTAPPVP